MAAVDPSGGNRVNHLQNSEEHVVGSEVLGSVVGGQVRSRLVSVQARTDSESIRC